VVADAQYAEKNRVNRRVYKVDKISRFLTKLTRVHKSERGTLNMAGLMMMGVMMIFLAVGFIIYPIILDGCDAILDYQHATYTNITDGNFTGLTSVTGVFPLISLLGFVTSGILTGFLGLKMVKTGSGRMSPGGLMMLGIGQVFVAIGLIIFPVVLDGCVTVYMDASIASYTGLSAVILVCPLIVLVSFLAGAVVTGYFGYKTTAGAAA
jgi:hypothetical protein